jgi:hypothetical protein
MLPEQAVAFIGFDQSTLIWQSLAWAAGITLVFAPLAVRLYRRVSD